MKKGVLLLILLSSLLLVGGCTESKPQEQAGSDATKEAPTQSIKQYTEAPKMTINPKKQYTAEIKTNLGSFTVELLANQAPKTVNNFVFLARDNFYNQVKFHRIMKDFMIQTGDPLGNGTGGPGYTFEDELPPALPYGPGVVAMANRGPNTNSSQFFICNGEKSKALNDNPNYTVFGRVVEGMDIVQKISNVQVEASARGEMSKPTQDVLIESISIIEK